MTLKLTDNLIYSISAIPSGIVVYRNYAACGIKKFVIEKL
jgi:hypothetical protein